MPKINLSNIQLNRSTVLIIAFVTLGILLFFAFLPPFNYWTLNAKDLNSNTFSNYGEFIGGLLGTIVSLFSFILIFKTLIEQRQQFIKNSFEVNFYSLLQNHRAILDKITENIEGISKNENGVDFFAVLAQRIAVDFGRQAELLDEKKIKRLCKCDFTGKERLIYIYGHYFHIYNSSLGHYFRNLYHFALFIQESEVAPDTKSLHFKILRAQLSNYEILLLAYNCLHPFGQKFKPIVEQQQLLKNLNFELGLDSQYYRRIVDPTILVNSFPQLKEPYNEQLALAKTQRNK